MCKTPQRNLMVTAGVLAALGIVLAFYSYRTLILPGDLPVTAFIQSFDNGFLRTVMEWVSYLFGSWRAVLLVALGSLLVWWRIGLLESLLVLAAGIITPINYLFKYIVNRSRPTPDLVNILVDESDLGFPSGHAFFSLIFLGILAYIIYCHLRSPWRRILSLAALSLLILLVGVSRIYLGVHWPSDVLGGYLFGGFFLILLVLFYRTFKKQP